jgi:hypothetical protein
MIPLAFGSSPFDAALLIALFGNFFPPDRDRPFHDADARREKKIFNLITWPFLALVAGIISFGFYATPDLAGFAKSVELLGWVRLHATQTFRFFRFGPIEVAHDRLEFFIAVPGGEVNPATSAV